MNKYIDKQWKRISLIIGSILLTAFTVTGFNVGVAVAVILFCLVSVLFLITIGSGFFAIMSFVMILISFGEGNFDDTKDSAIIFGVSLPAFLICALIINWLNNVGTLYR